VGAGVEVGVQVRIEDDVVLTEERAEKVAEMAANAFRLKLAPEVCKVAGHDPVEWPEWTACRRCGAEL
jgi:hypothetical protein